MQAASGHSAGSFAKSRGVKNRPLQDKSELVWKSPSVAATPDSALSFAGAGNVAVVSCQLIAEALAEDRLLAEAEGGEFGHADRGSCWRYIQLVEAD